MEQEAWNTLEARSMVSKGLWRQLLRKKYGPLRSFLASVVL